MELQEVLEKLRRADKVTVQDGTENLYCGNVNKCKHVLLEKGLMSREVDNFYPELLGGLVVNLKRKDIYETN